MASNPVSAFLAGFNAVDQLETNRARRDYFQQQQSFQREEMSWRRKAEKRKDDLYEQMKLQNYQNKKAAEFQATVDDIMMRVGASIKEHPDRAKELQNKWFDGPNAQANLVNEAWKRMIARDPSFGEHLAFAFGQDAASGSLVRDRVKPISTAGIAMPGQAGPGHPGGVWFGVDSVNGIQPMTQMRSSANGDPIFFGQPGLAELSAVFGDSALTDEFRIMGVLREGLGVDEPTGEPIEANKRGSVQTPGKPDKEKRDPATDPQERDRLISQRDNDREKAERNEAYWARHAELVASGMTEAEAAQAIREEQQGEADPGSSEEENFPPRAPSSFARGLPDAPTSQELYADVGLPDDPYPDNKIGPGGALASFDLGAAGDNLKAAGTSLLNAGKDTVEDIKNLFNSGADAYAAFNKRMGVGRFVSVKPKDINEVAKETGSPPAARFTPTADRLTEEEQKKVPSPKDEKEAADIVNHINNRQGTYRNNRPPIEDVFMMNMLRKTGAITMEDVMRFQRTGSLSKPIEAKFQLVTDNGVTTVFDMNRGVPVNQFRTGTGKGGSDEERFDAIKKYSAGKFTDEDGKTRQDWQDKFITEYDTATLMLGGDPTAEPSRNEVNLMAEAYKRTQQFDPDSSQNLGQGTADFKFWTDPKLGPNNLALGYLAVHYGYNPGDDTDRFLHDYGITYRAAHPRMNGETQIKRIQEIEEEVNEILRATRNNNKDSKGKKVLSDEVYAKYKSWDLNRTRTEYMKELLREGG